MDVQGICGSSPTEPSNPVEVDLSHFDPDRIVGRGGFGKVQAMTKNSTAGGDKGTMYAVKIMSKQVAVGRKMTAEFFTERNMLSALNHDFLVNAQYCFQDTKYCYIVMDLALGGDLKVRHAHLNAIIGKLPNSGASCHPPRRPFPLPATLHNHSPQGACILAIDLARVLETSVAPLPLACRHPLSRL